MTRQPYDTERPSALLRHLFYGTNRKWWQEETREGAHRLCGVFNDATRPNLLRSDEEHEECSRIAFLCRRIRANHYSTRSIQESGDGEWFVPSLR